MKLLSFFMVMISLSAFAEDNFSEEIFTSNPYCYEAVKKLKEDPFLDNKIFNQRVRSEISLIEKSFDQREVKIYGVISNFMKEARNKRSYQQRLSPMSIRKESFHGLTGQCDKLKHCTVSCKLAYACGFYGSRAIGRLKEIFHDLILGKGTPDMDDIRANEVGLAISDVIITDSMTQNEIYRTCESECASNILRLHCVYYDYKGEKFCKE